MITFWILAAVLVAGSTFWICRPLWQERSRITLLVTVVLFCSASAVLYSRWSGWQIVDEPVADTPAGMVSRLARRLEKSPEDLEGWLMLGRSHAALEQYPLAQRAFRRALRLADGRNAEALLGLGESLVLQADGEIDDLAARLFEEALALEPNSEKALFFAAVAAQRRGERDLAVERYRRMLAQEPPPNIRAIIDAQIRALGAEPAAGPAAASPAAAAAEVLVSVSLAPALAEAVRADQDASGGAVVFVFIRRPGESGPPLAAKRIAARLPFEVRLSESDAMLPGVTLQVGETVEVSARVARDGNATPRSGDPVGKMLYTIGRDAGKQLSIDGRTP